MAIVTRYSDKKVLIIEHIPSMRTQLQLMLTTFGFNKLHAVPSIREALKRIAEEKYDIFLCDYDLGEGTNGQQFLEYLRMHDLISRHALFIMVTGEGSYDKVMLAAECAADDYLLKPFTAEDFNIRLESLLERCDVFEEVDLAYDRKDWAKALEACDRIIAKKDKYFLYASKIRGALLLKLNRPQEAAVHYQEILAIKSLPWAKLGLAKAHAMMGDMQQAEAIAREVLQETPHYTAAYDFLAQILAKRGEKDGALEVLRQAREISPGTMSRIRHLSSLAVETGRHDIAEQVMQEALHRHRYSPVREAGDFVLLSHALSGQGKQDQAIKTLSEAKSSFRDVTSQALIAANQCIVHHRRGDRAQAETALSEALAAVEIGGGAAASVAEACFALGHEDKAHELLKNLIQNHPEDEGVRNRVHAVLSSAGKDKAEADAIIEANVQEVIRINNEGVRHAEAGELEAAIALLTNAADRLPNNLQIVSNAALVLALDLARNAFSPERLNACLKYREIVANKQPAYPKLAQIDALLKQIKRP
ncbi:MAG: response regulator [Methylophilaceae bacterium]|nr:response regulator [Methylophilaceae bacterium]